MPKSNRNCAVGGCSHTQRTCPKGRFVGFPNESKQPERRAVWIRLVQRGEEWVPTKNSRVCGCHFAGGYKVDDPRDPAYNPSIFPARPELDRRVRRAAVSEIIGFQAHSVDRHKSVYPSLLMPAKASRNQTDSNDVRNRMPEVIEGYAQTTCKRSEIVPKREEICGASYLVNNTTGIDKSGCLPVTEHRENANAKNSVPTSPSTSFEFICGARDQLPTMNQLQSTCNSSQNRGWLYIDQSKPGDGNEVLKRKRLLQAKRSMNAVRVQRFTATNRKLSGNLNMIRHSRSGQTRHIVRTRGVGTIADQRRTADSSVPCSSKQRLPTDKQPQSYQVPISNAKSHILVQTVLSMDSHKSDYCALDCTHLPTEAQSRCFGFHGWSDICFCDTTVQKLTGIIPKVFNLLVDKLQDVTAGLPPHNSLLLFLMKLKMAVPFELLGKIFGITSPTACNIFIHVLSILIGPLSDLIPRPSDLFNSSATKDNPSSWICKCNVVIDCLTIPTRFHLPEHNPEMPYRKFSMDSVKILVGLALNGCAFFVSDAHAGSVSNSDIFVHSALKSHLKKGGKIHLLEQDEQLQESLRAQGLQVMTPFSDSPLCKLSANPKIFPVFESGKMKQQVDMLTEDPTVNVPDSSFFPKVELVDRTLPEDELVDGLPESVDMLPESVDSLPAANMASISPHINTSCKHSQGTSCLRPVRHAKSGISQVYPSKLAQRLRSFSILTSILESELLPFIKDVVCICAALSNLQESDY